jgi:hypothetical protein
MLPNDETIFINQLLNIDGTYFIRQIFTNMNEMIIDPSRNLPMKDPRDRYIYICTNKSKLDKKYIIKGTYKNNEENKAVHTAKSTYYRIDENKANVIEFSRCILNPAGALVQGRLWVELYALINDRFAYKGKELDQLYKYASNWIRRNYKKVGGQDGYFGPEAETKFIKGELSLFP